jgi:hypothetical protein
LSAMSAALSDSSAAPVADAELFPSSGKGLPL